MITSSEIRERTLVTKLCRDSEFSQNRIQYHKCDFPMLASLLVSTHDACENL